ncbi:DUF5126 domain-containing protein [Proteiniphilum sp. UBA5310]|mgnify:CR=1 FL=1|jgi:hypothetical protein|uniref:DUF5126 domain-containing protein n=1 Tax=Proteiniphilum sp. UBA5310 TaxID=1947275 RepID=UPI00257FFB5E|nr:DUF5126 domain-containing protein [Proteiniphilum sp. UBA5310]
MKRYISYFLVLFTGALLFASCNDSYMGVEQVKTGSTKPDKIIVNDVVAKPGALEIHFTLPKGNENISKVEASYINKLGKKKEFSVSRYSSFILVEGFTGTNDVTVEIVCVDNSGNVSDITYVKKAPLVSSVELAFQSMIVNPAFGGVKIEWQNPAGNLLAIHVLNEDNIDKYETSLEEDPSKIIYSSESINTYAYVRPYDSRQQQFGFVISDKWGNRTDTLILSITPYKEERVDYRNIKALSTFNYSLYAGSRDYDQYGLNKTTDIQNDGNYHGASYGPETIFDNNRGGQQFYMYKYIKNFADGDPTTNELIHTAYSTYNLNADVRLSRIKLFQRTHYTYHYNRSSPKRFRIWGTDDSNVQWSSKFPDTWTLIGEYVGREPEDRNNLTPEEIEYFLENNEFMIDEDNVNLDARPTTSFRYMRIEWLETYDQNIPYYTLNELEMYGDVIRKY